MNNVDFLFFVSCAIVVLGGVYLIGFNFGVNWALKKYAEIEAKLKQKNGYAEEKNT